MDESLDFDKVLEWLYHKNYIMSTTNVMKVLTGVNKYLFTLVFRMYLHANKNDQHLVVKEGMHY